MSKNSLGIIGTELEIIRQRFFVDYTTKSDKHFSEEFTFFCTTDAKDGIDNVFLKIPNVLPNLRIYDSDGESLPLITKRLFNALLRKRIREAIDPEIKTGLEQLQNDVKERKYFVLWIKLPSTKRLHIGDSKVITLEYDASREDIDTKQHIQELSSEQYEVFYVIKPPEDYEIDETNFIIYDENGLELKRHDTTWPNNSGDPIYFDPDHKSISIRVRPQISDKIIFTYSFKPIRSILSLPRITLWFLIGASIFLLIPKLLGITSETIVECTNSVCFDLTPLVVKDAEVSVGIIGASLIIAGLINNHDIRDSFKWRFFIPIVIAAFALILKFRII